jgi:hypothetical protein
LRVRDFPRATVVSLPFICVALGACAATQSGKIGDQPAVGLGQEFTLTLGESIGMSGKQAIIEFSKVIEDSRCPMNARCIWEGNAKIALEIKEFSAADGKGKVLEVLGSTIELNTSSRFPTRQKVSDFTLELIRLEPTPMAGAQTTGYAVTLIGVSP